MAKSKVLRLLEDACLVVSTLTCQSVHGRKSDRLIDCGVEANEEEDARRFVCVCVCVYLYLCLYHLMSPADTHSSYSYSNFSFSLTSFLISSPLISILLQSGRQTVRARHDCKNLMRLPSDGPHRPYVVP